MFSILSRKRLAKAARPRRRFQPQLEVLEDRRVLNGAFLDDFEGSALDPFWSTAATSGSIVFPSTDLAHGGQQSVELVSTNTSENKNISLSHVFADPVYGTVSVWLYDTGAGVSSSNYLGLLAWDSEGHDASIGTFDYDLGPSNGGSYYINPLDSEEAINTGIVRSQDWHLFSITATPLGTSMQIDGVTVHESAGGAPLSSIGLSMGGPSWRPAWSAYFDDFAFVPYEDDGCLTPPDGLVAWWPGDGTAEDLAGSNDGALVNGATFATGMVGQAFRLDGTNDFVSIPDDPSLTPTTAITIQGWVYPDTITGSRVIVSKYQSNDAIPSFNISWGMSSIGGRLQFGVYPGGTEARVVLTDNVVLTAGAWYHVAGTFDAATQAMKIYGNGVEVASSFLPGHDAIVNAINDSDSPVRIGSVVGSAGVPLDFWDGLIDELSIFGRALSAAEIDAIYNAGSTGMCKPSTVDIAVLSAGLQTGNTLQFTFETTGNPGPFDVGLYRSADATFDASDILLDTQTITPAATNPQTPGAFSLPSPWPSDPSRPYLLVVADPENAIDELAEDNNHQAVALADLTATSFNYSVSVSSGIITNTLIPIDANVAVTGTIQNQGVGDAGPFAVKLYISTDSTIDPGADHLVSTLASIPALGAGESYELAATTLLPSTLPLTFFGKVWIGIAVDAGQEVPESNVANNWNQLEIDVREVQLVDPISTPTTLTFASKAAALRYLTSNGFRAPLPEIMGYSLDAGWSKELGPTYSRFNGQNMPAGAFRLQSSNPIYNATTGLWELHVEGPEPNPRKALQLADSFGDEWLAYVAQYQLQID